MRRFTAKFAREAFATASLPRHHRIVEPVVGQAGVAINAGVAERRVFIPPERKDRLVHLLGVEHLEAHEQVRNVE